MADAKDPPPAYEAVPTEIREYHSSYAPTGRKIHSSNSVVVVSQPTQNMVRVVQPRSPDYTGLAICSWLGFCCQLGLVAIIFATQWAIRCCQVDFEYNTEIHHY
ncbi:uncharacterized protein LOC127870306 [Dreissena polymorpha]|uniref:Uncharacterized protein n=1 Tax=Dreissena polymorpha TaxID=45954 RepID=A0A9D4M1F9_DREPO|nr:uncharacterized protein LOC127870306 [Dreissena polymorpha]KAH3867594.1 hypothetical protein DPMN_030726 [Dreissena polymorpha]